MEYNSKNMINMEFGDKRKVEYWVDIYDVHEKVEISPHIYEHLNLVCPLLYRNEKDPLFPPPSGTFFGNSPIRFISEISIQMYNGFF